MAATFTGKPYAADEFTEWYKCPKAMLKKGKSFSDPTNWGTRMPSFRRQGALVLRRHRFEKSEGEG